MRPERRPRQRVHRDHAREAPDGDQVVHLDLRPEGEPEEAAARDAVAGDARLAAEEAGNISEHAATISPTPSEIMAKVVPARRVVT